MTFELADMARKDRRERIAMRCLQGLLAGQYGGDEWGGVMCLPPINELAESAVQIADALMAELDKSVEPAKGGKLCVGCNRALPADRFAEASPSHPTRDGRVYKCKLCAGGS